MDVIKDFTERGRRIVDALREELRGIRANRAHAGLVEDITVTYYGTPTQLKHIASVQVKPPRELLIQAWDKEAVPQIMKGIEAANLGISPTAEGQNIRIFLPELSSERREELLKAVKRLTEDYRVRLRTLRDEFRKRVAENEKAGDLSEDDKYRLEEEIQKATDKFNGEIEEAFKKKGVEISE